MVDGFEPSLMTKFPSSRITASALVVFGIEDERATWHLSLKNYLASIAVIVTLFTEGTPAELINDPCSATFLPATKAGCLGSGRATFSFTIIEMTSDIVGRSAGLSWTQMVLGFWESHVFVYDHGDDIRHCRPISRTFLDTKESYVYVVGRALPVCYPNFRLICEVPIPYSQVNVVRSASAEETEFKNTVLRY
uniref:Uncharacterized protein n=1 Tax=Salix viminalis TaxID=40686 RepID=A0A6N2M3R6_SALVM